MKKATVCPGTPFCKGYMKAFCCQLTKKSEATLTGSFACTMSLSNIGKENLLLCAYELYYLFKGLGIIHRKIG